MFFDNDMRSRLVNHEHWEIQGVIGISYDGKHQSINYTYSQFGDDFILQLYGLLGIGFFEIKGKSDEIELEGYKTSIKNFNQIRDYMIKNFGWYIHHDYFKFWIKGLPVPDIMYQCEFNTNNTIKFLNQRGWNIIYKNYSLIDYKYLLPSKITMHKDNLVIKIVVKSWNI